MATRLVAPGTAEEASALLASAPSGTVAILSGGTDLLPEIDFGVSAPQQLLSLRRLPWRDHAWTDGHLRIGSTLPLAELERDPELRRRIPGIAQAVGAVGSLALRRKATIGGNLVRASPASDLLPILLALEATVRLVGPSGEREIPLAELLVAPRKTSLAPSELVRSVLVPARPSAYLWQRVRPANDVSQIGVAVSWDATADPVGWRIAVAGVRPLAHRVSAAETLLRGSKPGATEVERAARVAAEEVEVRNDRRASDTYRRHLLRVLVTRAVAAVVSGAGA
jgi:CO/xanthine dehydrogenase FAD-binding subunit